MSPQTQALAARLRASPRFEWAVGMREPNGVRISWVQAPGATGKNCIAGGIRDNDHRVRPANGAVFVDDVPDLADPATVGVLIARARADYGQPTLRVRWSGSHGCWQVWIDAPWPTPKRLVAESDTEGGAVAAALLSLWETPVEPVAVSP